MRTLLIWFGYCLFAFGLLLLSPLRDFLPVDLLPLSKGIFSSENAHMYLRVVPSNSGVDPLIWVNLAVSACGLVCVAIGYLMKVHR